MQRIEVPNGHIVSVQTDCGQSFSTLGNGRQEAIDPGWCRYNDGCAVL